MLVYVRETGRDREKVTDKERERTGRGEVGWRQRGGRERKKEGRGRGCL